MAALTGRRGWQQGQAMIEPQAQGIPGWLKLAGGLLLLLGLLGATLVASGLFDPRPGSDLGPVLTPGRVTIPAGAAQTTWLTNTLRLDQPFSLRLTAALATGEADSGYGVALGGPAAEWVVALSPLGYVAIWQTVAGQRVDVLPWQTWPHARPGTTSNEFQLDVQAGQMTVRINRERLWQGEWPPAGLPASGQVGLYAQSFGDSATFDFQALAIGDWAP